jgi:hydrogenase assembly chaperone HypC/HupF
MTLAVPGKVVEVRGGRTIVELFGSRKEVRTKFVDVSVGDFVLVEQGMIVEKLTQEDAMYLLDEWSEMNEQENVN